MPALPETPGWVMDRRRQIGRRIQRHREHVNVTQDQLRDRTGLSRSTIQRVESGDRESRLSWLILISDALGIPLGTLLSVDPEV